jgi:hypothetical protein
MGGLALNLILHIEQLLELLGVLFAQAFGKIIDSSTSKLTELFCMELLSTEELFGPLLVGLVHSGWSIAFQCRASPWLSKSHLHKN